MDSTSSRDVCSRASRSHSWGAALYDLALASPFFKAQMVENGEAAPGVELRPAPPNPRLGVGHKIDSRSWGSASARVASGEA
ncbi:hypothetical protein H632_c226p1 [Helicosporidium sp. ATCC 50920]|nr:hypothetical protein H632_c226p1 [Helicosporidium sp. ATCC 50920]|eukprot:KDD76437.1 hypothetical protein H632_c226p1 [Helicosporidium sp. ATCC 50920]